MFLYDWEDAEISIDLKQSSIRAQNIKIAWLHAMFSWTFWETITPYVYTNIISRDPGFPGPGPRGPTVRSRIGVLVLRFAWCILSFPYGGFGPAGYWLAVALTGNGERGFDSGEGP